MSKQIRVLLGGALMLLGYVPAALDVVRRTSDSNVTEQLASNAEEAKVFCEKSDGDILDGDVMADSSTGALFSSLANADIVGSAMQDILHGDFSSLMLCNEQNISFVPEHAPVTEDKPKVSWIKTVSRGEFVGSKLVKSEIQSNFYADARRLGVPANVVDTVIGSISSKIDFRRSLKKGDRFEILYSPKNETLYARIMTKHCKVAIYRFGSGSNVAYYFENGQKVCFDRGSFFGPPLTKGLRVSSFYGYRRHPINGRLANHTGVDFVAAYGAPVHAIFDGVVTRASYYYGYGHCVDIKHRSGYSSRYAHLSGYCVRCGSHVKKGQIVGRVGSSGSSTGSHLHLELAKNNRTINPLSVKMMPAESGVVQNQKQFNALKKQINFLFAK
ncbi:MAG: M23 family metallopeptidase [Holosporaceae bacterium]|nr:M23 family metallopeptidase [Holosporaceae bacterium]